MPAVALTDHGSLAGRGRALPGGARQALADRRLRGVRGRGRRAQTKGYAHLTLAETNEGYANLIKLSSLGYLEGYYHKPRVDWELLETHAKGSSRSRGVSPGRVSRALAEERLHGAFRPRPPRADLRARLDVHDGLQNAGLEEQKQINPKLVGLAEEAGLPLVAAGTSTTSTPDVPRTRRSSTSSRATR